MGMPTPSTHNEGLGFLAAVALCAMGCTAGLAPESRDSVGSALLGTWEPEAEDGLAAARYAFSPDGRLSIRTQGRETSCRYALVDHGTIGDLSIECGDDALRTPLSLDAAGLRLGTRDAGDEHQWSGEVRYERRVPETGWQTVFLQESTAMTPPDDGRARIVSTKSSCASVSTGFQGECRLGADGQVVCNLGDTRAPFDPFVLRGAADLAENAVRIGQLAPATERWRWLGADPVEG